MVQRSGLARKIVFGRFRASWTSIGAREPARGRRADAGTVALEPLSPALSVAWRAAARALVEEAARSLRARRRACTRVGAVTEKGGAAAAMEADEEAAIATRRARKQAALRQQKPPAKATRHQR